MVKPEPQNKPFDDARYEKSEYMRITSLGNTHYVEVSTGYTNRCCDVVDVLIKFALVLVLKQTTEY